MELTNIQAPVEQNVKMINTDLPDIIELKQIKQVYDGKPPVLDGLNLLIEDKPNQGQFVVLLGPSGCVDKDTEFFNGIEWKAISSYDKTDKVLQYEPNGNATLVYPEAYIKTECKWLYHMSSKYGIDQMICPDHRVIYIDDRRPTTLLETTGDELYNIHQKNKCGFNGQFITTFNYKNDSEIALSDFEIRLSVAAIADGSYVRNSNYCRFNFKKQRKIDRLVWILNELNIEYELKFNKNTGYTTITCNTPRNDKLYTSYWYGCSNKQLQIITDEAIYWDGSNANNRQYIATNVKETADFLQFAYSACGIRSTINTTNRIGEKYKHGNYTRRTLEYKVILSQNKFVSLSNCNKKITISKVDTTDNFKYCFTVQSGMLVLRRNDKIFITGNCGKSTLLRYIAQLQKPTAGEVLMYGRPITQADRVGMVFQQYSSFPWLTVLENVALGLTYKGVSAKERSQEPMS